MAKQDVERQHIRISTAPRAGSSIQHVDEVYIVITQAYCPRGHNLIEDGNDTFDGYPGIKLRLEYQGEIGNVTLSPFHGDNTKKGKTDWAAGTRLNISCPICSEPIPKMATCRCPGNGDLVKVYLTPQTTNSHVLGLCNIWGCRRSRTINNWQIISEYFDGQIED